MAKRKGGQYPVKIKPPKWCETCLDRDDCEAQKLPPWSQRRFHTPKHWARISPKPCPKVRKWADQDYGSIRERTFERFVKFKDAGEWGDFLTLDIMQHMAQGGHRNKPVYYHTWQELKTYFADSGLNFPFLTRTQNLLLYLKIFQGKTYGQMAMHLSGDKRSLKTKDVENELKKAIRKLKKYADKYGMEYIKEILNQRKGGGD